jgi:hypothetical protein
MVEVLAIGDRLEVAQQIAKAVKASGVLNRDQIAIPAELQRIPESDPWREVVHYQPGMQKSGE